MSARRKTRSAPILAIADVTDLSHEGRGIAHIDGKTVFIEDALPGERVELRIVNRTRTFDEAQLVQVLEPADLRAEPRCAHFGVCGGCALQHFAPEGQMAFKQRQLIEALARIGKVEPQRVLEPLTADVWNYRRKARLAAILGVEAALGRFGERAPAAGQLHVGFPQFGVLHLEPDRAGVLGHFPIALDAFFGGKLVHVGGHMSGIRLLLN